jgi:hypothetical protein
MSTTTVANTGYRERVGYQTAMLDSIAHRRHRPCW